MLRTLNLIPLRVIPYSDRNSILSAYSRELGRVSFVVPSGAGREARRRRALLMPMCPGVGVADVVPGKEVLHMRDPQPCPPMQLVVSDPLRASMAMFLSEVLLHVLRQSEGEPALFDFVRNAAVRLNSPDVVVGNFHIVFLCRLLVFLGIAPDVASYRPGMLFDMADAVFRVSAPMHGRYLTADETAAAAALGRMTWENMHLYKYTRAQRARVLDGLLEYLSLHHVGLSGLKSLDVMRDLFD